MNDHIPPHQYAIEWLDADGRVQARELVESYLDARNIHAAHYFTRIVRCTITPGSWEVTR